MPRNTNRTKPPKPTDLQKTLSPKTRPKTHLFKESNTELGISLPKQAGLCMRRGEGDEEQPKPSVL